MATGTYAPNPVFTGWDDNGNPLSGGLLYTYAAGTTTPLATYTDVGLTVANANPIVLDAAGRATIFLAPASYKWILKTSAAVTVWTRDNVGSVPTSTIDNDVTGTAGEALTATELVYGGSGATWLKADADAQASSAYPQIAFVVADTASSGSGTFRLSGRMTGFSALTPGADYYASAVAGAITSTPPPLARYVGWADSISSLIISPNPRPSVIPKPPCGRLTLLTGVPVPPTDVTAATTLYYAPYQGNSAWLYDGTKWSEYTFTQRSIAVPATTNQMYDVFLYNNAGTLTLELTAWTNDTTRATALTTQDGFYVKTGALTRLYLGSFRTTGVSGQTEDSGAGGTVAKRYLYNYFNRVTRPLLRVDTTDTWAYTVATWRQANAANVGTANQVEIVTGVQEDSFSITVASYSVNTSASVVRQTGIGIGSTTTPPTALAGIPITTAAANDTIGMTATYSNLPTLGYQYYAWLERSTATGATTWYGDGAALLAQAGMWGWSRQ